MTSIDWESLDGGELEQIINQANYWLSELNRRTEIYSLLEELNGFSPPPGATWVQPTGAHDAYPLRATVIHSGRLWESAHPFNVWEPGTGDLWTDRGVADTPDPFPVEDFPEWAPNVSVNVGDVYSYNGVAYSVVQAHTTQAGWEPPAVPALWKKVG